MHHNPAEDEEDDDDDADLAAATAVGLAAGGDEQPKELESADWYKDEFRDELTTVATATAATVSAVEEVKARVSRGRPSASSTVDFDPHEMELDTNGNGVLDPHELELATAEQLANEERRLAQRQAELEARSSFGGPIRTRGSSSSTHIARPVVCRLVARVASDPARDILAV